MKPLNLAQIYPAGELGARAALLYSRMESPIYRPDVLYTIESGAWPGDWEGRTILSLSKLWQSTGKMPSYLHEIMSIMEDHLNERGYLGPILPDGEFDEQQLSGHGWLLRGLCSYYEITRCEVTLRIIRRIVENLYLPLRGRMGTYPILPEERVGGGAESGSIGAELRGWRVSTDTGCVFISMDGLSHAYAVTEDGRIAELLSEMRDRFDKMDLLGTCAQTHASLTASRAMMRMYELTQDEGYLAIARRVYDLYVNEGMTANYANYNWFGRPEWTEPCAIIDSYLLAMQLYAATGELAYADVARRIYDNGIGHAQRPNGGFGCDKCAGPENGNGAYLENSCYEAYWCCTMRGGEGLSFAAQYALLSDGDGFCIPSLMPFRAETELDGAPLTLALSTSFPYEGRAVLTASSAKAVTVKIRIPDFAKGLRLNGAPAEAENGYLVLTVTGERSFEITFDIPLTIEAPHGKHNKAGKLFLHGSLILGTEDDCGAIDPSSLVRGEKVATYEGNGIKLAPINDTYLIGENKVHTRKLRILFDVKA